MTPEQLERIKAYIGECTNESQFNILEVHGTNNPLCFIYKVRNIDDEFRKLLAQFITEAINEKLARINPGSDKIFLDVRNIEPIGITVTVTDKNGKPVVTEFKPIDPE